MNSLSAREIELVALGAALASNCVPCVEHHIPVARKIGLSDQEIKEVIELADKVRKVPADKVLKTALNLIAANSTTASASEAEKSGCGCS